MSEERQGSDSVDFVPEQVRRQAQRADELQKQFIEEHGGEPAAPSEQPEQPTTVVEPEQPELPPPVGADWEQRYKTLQGKYDHEIGMLRAQLEQTRQLIANIQAPPPAPAQSPPHTGQFNEADVELYGQDLLDAAARAADARYAGVIAELRNKISQLEGGQAHQVATTSAERLFRQLDQDPEISGYWRDLNVNQNFINWLQGVDEYSGLSRNTMLQHAYNTGDAVRTGRFFKKYMAENGHTVTPPSPAASQTGNVPARPNPGGNGYQPAGGSRLEDLAAPGRAAGAGSGNGAPQSRLWSRSDIKAFYHDRTTGRYRGREAEAQRLEEDLFAADREGRLV